MGDPTKAALAPWLAAGIYGSDMLGEDVEDEEQHDTFRRILQTAHGRTMRKKRRRSRPIFRVRNVPPRFHKNARRLRDNGAQHRRRNRKLHGRRRIRRDTFSRMWKAIRKGPRLGESALEELRFFSREVGPQASIRAARFRETTSGPLRSGIEACPLAASPVPSLADARSARCALHLLAGISTARLDAHRGRPAAREQAPRGEAASHHEGG